MASRPHTTFPAEHLSSAPQSVQFRNRPVRRRRNSTARQQWRTQLQRWFCCACASRGLADPTGIANRDAHGRDISKCPAEKCGHRKCRNCALGPSEKAEFAVRTVGGLFTSPRFIDPVRWECPCTEWEANIFDASCEFDVTMCASPKCAKRTGRDVGRLMRTSVVLNVYGERLGTADQTLMAAEGPWDLQRRALADPKAALVRDLRHAGFRGVGCKATRDETRLWLNGKPAPEFPSRPEPPTRVPDTDDWNKMVGYEGGYLAGIPMEPLDWEHHVEDSESPNLWEGECSHPKTQFSHHAASPKMV